MKFKWIIDVIGFLNYRLTNDDNQLLCCISPNQFSHFFINIKWLSVLTVTTTKINKKMDYNTFSLLWESNCRNVVIIIL